MENRLFIPGSEWVYFKIYTGSKTADVILKNELYKYVNELLKSDFIDKWFFIRYVDPDFHIRLRFHMKERRDLNFVFSRFQEIFLPVVNSGLVWKIQCDTYQRELERYGANTIAIVEDFFFIDSVYIILLLHLLDNENPEQQRWKLAMALIDSFLSAFSYDIPQRKELLNMMATNHKKEFGFNHHQTGKQLNDKCRTYRKEIENAMLWETEVSEINNVIKSRRQAIYLIAEKLSSVEQAGELQVNMKDLQTSLIHITMNRWFRTKNRLYEMVIYEFLSRFYSSELAKNNKKHSLTL